MQGFPSIFKQISIVQIVKDFSINSNVKMKFD